MAACNQTDIPVLNIQEDPCIQGTLSTNCIFYGLAINYLGTQDSTNFAGTLGYIVAKLEAGNNLATDLEEINRAQSLLIEELQESIAESLVALSEVQILLEECCPEPTTTTSTTTVAPTTTTTTTNSTTTTTNSGVNYVFFSSGNNPTEACNSSNFVSLYWAGNSDPNGKQVFTDPNLTQGYYTSGSLATNGNVYSSSNGYLFLQGSCSSYTTTTITPTTSTTTTGPTQQFEVYAVPANYYYQTGLTGFSSMTNTVNVYLPGNQYFGQPGAVLYLDEDLTIPLNNPGISEMYVQIVGNDYVYTTYLGFSGSGVYSPHFPTQVRSAIVSYSWGIDYVGYVDGTGTLRGTNLAIVYYDVNQGFGVGSTLYDNIDLTVVRESGLVSYMAVGIPYVYVPENQSIFRLEVNGIISSDMGPLLDHAFVTIPNIQISHTGICEEFYSNGIMLEPHSTSLSFVTGATVYGNFNVSTNQWDLLDPYWLYAKKDDVIYPVVSGVLQNPVSCITTTTSTTTTIAPTTTTTTTEAPSGTVINLGVVGQFPSSIVLDEYSNAYVTNVNSHNVTKTTSDGVTTIFGSAQSSPYDLVRDSLGNVYTVHLGHDYIRKITPSGVSTIFATAASNLQTITKDSLDNLYALSSVAGTITKITPDGTVTAFANVGSAPQGIAVDSLGNVYTTNLMSKDITKVTPSGIVTTLATFTTAHPRRLAIDSLDNLYVSTDESTVKKVTPSGAVTTYNMPGGGLQEVTVDTSNNIYVLDQIAKSIFKITPSGTVTTLVTMGGGPIGLATDSNYIYTADSNNGYLLKIKL